MGKLSWMIALSFTTCLLTSGNAALADEQSLHEFKAYVQGKLSGLSDAELDQIAKLVDKNNDNVISDAEFDARMEAVQQVMAEDEVEAEDEDEDEDDQRPNRRGRRARMNQRMQARLESAGVKEGEQLPDVTGLDIEGQPFALSQLKGNYSVIVSGCLT